MKHELLAPAGDMESLYQAIHHGADAVYLGMKSFGARAYSKNFDLDEMVSAIKTCHLYGVKIYVTMNTLVKDHEVSSFLEQVSFLYTHGVDAIIMQDYGMINLVRRMYPNLDIHASTQANNSSIDTIRMFHELGVKRVVLSRELPLSFIQKIDLPIELEVFIHGALCISYSGNCLMSSMIGKRSGNRGECAGSCRLIYDLYKNGSLVKKNKYLLSTRELNTSSLFQQLLNSNIKSFKIEGRMKSPEYVGFITSFYRKLIDGEEFDLSSLVDQLKTLYHREFTTGHLFESKAIMNIKTPNHIGLEIGKVIEVNQSKIKIRLYRVLNQEDGIRFLESGKGLIVNYLYNQNHQLVSSSNDIVYIDNKIGLTTKDKVYKTLDHQLKQSLKKYELKKIPVEIIVKAIIDQPLRVIFFDGLNKIEVEGNVVEKSLTSPLDQQRVKKQMTKLGNSPFICHKIQLKTSSQFFIPIKELNDIRRQAVEKLIERREKKVVEIEKKEVTFKPIALDYQFLPTCSVYTQEQLQQVLALDFQRIYVHDFKLYQSYHDPRLYYFPRRNIFSNGRRPSKHLISEYTHFDQHIGHYSLNVTNIYTGYYLLLNGLKNIPLSVELTEEEIKSFYRLFIQKFGFSPPIEVLSYGRVENMVIKGNVVDIDQALFTYSLRDKKERVFPIYYQDQLTYVLNSRIWTSSYSFNFSYIKRFDFYEEGKEEILKVVNQNK